MEIYETYEAKSSIYRKALKYSTALAKKIMLAAGGIVTVTLLVVIIVPLVVFVISDARFEILPFKLPLIDNETKLGYLVTSFSHIVMLVVALYGNFVCDTWLYVFVVHIGLIKDILKCKFNELDEILETNPRNTAVSTVPLFDIFGWHQKYCNFSNSIRKIFFWIIFVQITTQFFGVVCSIVCMFLGVWPPAPVFGLYLYSLILSYCALGNIVESSNDDIICMIYDCCWYNLTVPEQKMLLVMLRESQVSAALSVGGVAPLSLNTGLQLTKTMYTLTMMLKQSFD